MVVCYQAITYFNNVNYKEKENKKLQNMVVQLKCTKHTAL